MRKVLTIAVAALMVVAIAGAVSAAVPSETNWRFTITADNGDPTPGGAGPAMQLGVYPLSLDGVDPDPPKQDTVAAFGADLPSNARWIVGVIPGDTTNVYNRDIKSNASPYTYPLNHKVWDLRVMANVNADAKPIRLVFKALNNSNPLATAGGLPIFFELKMIDNKGVVGAPDNGTLWSIPIPTGAGGSIFWQMDTALDVTGHAWGNLPLLKAGSGLSASVIEAGGYEMQFRVVPEPSSLLAMGSGLAGLIGFAFRRRRA